MQHIELDGVRYKLPQTWDDVDPDRLGKLVELVFLLPESGRLYHALIQHALNIRPKAWKQIHQRHFGPKVSGRVRRKNAEVLQQVVSMLRWMWTEPMHRQPFPSLVVTGNGWKETTWLLPEEGFKTLSFGELTDLYIHLQAFIGQTVPGNERLNYLVATACRPQRERGYRNRYDWNGDHREPYNEFAVRERVGMAAALDHRIKTAVLLYVASNINRVLAQYELFDKEPPGATPESDGAAEAYAGQGFIKNAHLLAEKGIFGTLRQTQEANCHEVLLFLEEYRADGLARQQAQNEPTT